MTNYRRFAWCALWITLALPALPGCSSDQPPPEEQSQKQSEVLGEHFKSRLPESRETK